MLVFFVCNACFQVHKRAIACSYSCLTVSVRGFDQNGYGGAAWGTGHQRQAVKGQLPSRTIVMTAEQFI